MSYGKLGSSVDSEKLSTTVKGLIPFLAILATAFKLEITEADLTQVGDLAVVAFVSVSGAISALTALYGGFRKHIINKLRKQGRIV